MYTINETGSVKVTLEAEGYGTESLEVEQSSKVTISKLTVTFSHSTSNSPGQNDPRPEITVSGGTVTYGSVKSSRSRSGQNYNFTVTYENVIFDGVTNQSVVTATYAHSSGWNHRCSYSGSSTVGDLISHPTIQMTAQ
jgi:hypothetical protein